METSPRFDLNQSLQIWTDELQQKDALGDEACRELEQHLRESMAALQANGILTEEEAFWVARHRLGSPQALRTEYGKVNSQELWRRRILWLWLGGLLFGFTRDLQQLLVLGWSQPGNQWSFAALAVILKVSPFVLGFVLAHGIWGISLPRVESRLKTRSRAAVLLGLMAGILSVIGNLLNWNARPGFEPYIILLVGLSAALLTGVWVASLFPRETKVRRIATA